MKIFSCFLIILIQAAPLHAAPPGYKLAKEKGVIYLQDILDEKDKVSLKVTKATPVFSTKDATNQLGTLVAGQQAQLEGFTPFAVRVRGKGGNGMMVGWANPRDFETPSPDFFDTLRKIAERREQVMKLIAAKQAAIGMTTGEVGESLGKPTKRASRQTADGRTEVWEYIDYEIISHYDTVRDPVTGANYRKFAYNEKIEKGKTTVEFKDDVVISLGEKEDLSRKRDLGIVPVPLDFRFP